MLASSGYLDMALYFNAIFLRFGIRGKVTTIYYGITNDWIEYIFHSNGIFITHLWNISPILNKSQWNLSTTILKGPTERGHKKRLNTSPGFSCGHACNDYDFLGSTTLLSSTVTSQFPISLSECNIPVYCDATYSNSQVQVKMVNGSARCVHHASNTVQFTIHVGLVLPTQVTAQPGNQVSMNCTSRSLGPFYT